MVSIIGLIYLGCYCIWRGIKRLKKRYKTKEELLNEIKTLKDNKIAVVFNLTVLFIVFKLWVFRDEMPFIVNFMVYCLAVFIFYFGQIIFKEDD